MSDFLTNLISRSRTAEAAIQPRLPSLFETAADAASVQERPGNTSGLSATAAPPARHIAAERDRGICAG